MSAERTEQTRGKNGTARAVASQAPYHNGGRFSRSSFTHETFHQGRASARSTVYGAALDVAENQAMAWQAYRERESPMTQPTPITAPPQRHQQKTTFPAFWVR